MSDEQVARQLHILLPSNTQNNIIYFANICLFSVLCLSVSISVKLCATGQNDLVEFL